ncbi:gustatory receptor 77 [Tribolium castaneum]|uniref:Gustatory receptor n=1 Tax=Tribolium castaneum TaxID=7070 RepID=D6WXU0_TRICA|nr:gustatory receptor 77 [Tribolium castaneum]
MSLKALDTVFKIGKYILLTPETPTTKKPSLKKRFYALLLIIIYTITSSFCMFLQSAVFRHRSLMQNSLRVVVSMNSYFSAIFSLIRINSTTRSWYYMVKNLSQVSSSGTNCKCTFMAWFTVVLITRLYDTFVFMKMFGFRFLIYSVSDLVLFFRLIFSIITAITVLQMIQQCYHFQKKTLLTRIANSVDSDQVFETLAKLQPDFFCLQKAVSHFNDIFGWDILFYEFFVVCRTLVYIDDTVKMPEHLRKRQHIDVVLEISLKIVLMAFFWLLILHFTLVCDQVLKKYEEILNILLKIKFFLRKKVNKRRSRCLRRIEQSCPEFSAARFYCINRATLFSLLNAATTFLIVLLQFKVY